MKYYFEHNTYRSRGKYENGNGIFTIDTGDIKYGDKYFRLSFEDEISDQTSDVKSMIPDDAVDMTSMFFMGAGMIPSTLE